jgi:hypothetical protein
MTGKNDCKTYLLTYCFDAWNFGGSLGGLDGLVSPGWGAGLAVLIRTVSKSNEMQSAFAGDFSASAFVWAVVDAPAVGRSVWYGWCALKPISAGSRQITPSLVGRPMGVWPGRMGGAMVGGLRAFCVPWCASVNHNASWPDYLCKRHMS